MRFSVTVNRQQANPVITLKDSLTNCKAEIYAFGGFLNAFYIPLKEKGMVFNCIEGFSSVADARKNIVNSFRSAKLSPFVCKLRNGTYQLDGMKYKMHKHFAGEHALHGLLFDAQFKVFDQSASNESAELLLQFTYNKTDQGYPFAFDMTLHWKLEPGNKISVTTTVQHSNNRLIPYTDGWHPYFTLGGKVDDYTLQFNTDSKLVFDEDLVPTGEKITDGRFLNATSLKKIFLDNSFLLPDSVAAKIMLENKKMRLAIEPDNHYHIIQIYTPPTRNSIAIENLTGAPDNFNNGIGLLMLEPHKPYSFTTSYSLLVK